MKATDFFDKVFERKDGKKDWCTAWPDKMFGVDYGDDCKEHDLNIEGKRTATRKTTDVLLRLQMQRRYNESNKPIRGFIWSWITYFGTRIFGTTQW